MTAIAEIIPGKLYQGNAESAKNRAALGKLGVTHIVNATPDVPNYYETLFTYYRIPLEDGSEKFSCEFSKACRFIEKGGTVFVHCLQGISRSVAIAAAYIMQKERLTSKAALAQIRQKNPKANPHRLLCAYLMGRSCQKEKRSKKTIL